jgi:hypothetical protein
MAMDTMVSSIATTIRTSASSTAVTTILCERTAVAQVYFLHTIVAFPAINYGMCWPPGLVSAILFNFLEDHWWSHIFHLTPAHFKTVVFAFLLLSPNTSRKVTEMKRGTRQCFGS